VEKIAREIYLKTRRIQKPLKIAVMGCEVNGPGEAKEADLGIALGKTQALIFKKGKIITKTSNQAAVKTILGLI
jgi:(E)-4-hydroxy-3-methylbut-2-enyl-diphosphate synthase